LPGEAEGAPVQSKLARDQAHAPILTTECSLTASAGSCGAL